MRNPSAMVDVRSTGWPPITRTGDTATLVPAQSPPPPMGARPCGCPRHRRPGLPRRAAAIGHQHGGQIPGGLPRVRSAQRERPTRIRPVPAAPRPGHPVAGRGQPSPVRALQAALRLAPRGPAPRRARDRLAREGDLGVPLGRRAHPLCAGEVRVAQPPCAPRDRRGAGRGALAGAADLRGVARAHPGP